MVDLYTLSVFVFFAMLAVLIYRDRKNIDFKYILFMRRTKRFRNTLNKIAKKSPRFWKTIGTIAFLVCLFFMFNGVYVLSDAAYKVYTDVIKEPTLSIALPTPFEQTIVTPGFIGIPFWFWIVIVSTILIPHEAFHGIIARAEKIRLKEVGLLLLAIFPGAFVEPDEKQLKKSKLMTKLRIFSAGSFINIVIGFTIILLVQNLLWAPNIGRVLITDIRENSTAQETGLEKGMVLEVMNGRDLTINFDLYSFILLRIPGSNTENVAYTLADFTVSQALQDTKPGDVVSLQADGTEYDLELEECEEEENCVRVGFGGRTISKDSSLFNVVFPLLGMMALLNMLVGIFNILPIYPLDGGLIVQAIAERFAKKRSRQIVKAITFIILIILIYNVIGPYL